MTKSISFLYGEIGFEFFFPYCYNKKKKKKRKRKEAYIDIQTTL